MKTPEQWFEYWKSNQSVTWVDVVKLAQEDALEEALPLLDALQFYADDESYRCPDKIYVTPSKTFLAPDKIYEDSGERAKQALVQWEKGKT